MSKYKQGKRVVATTDLAFGIFSTVRAGGRGVIRQVQESWIRSTTYKVEFDGGAEGWVEENHLRAA